VKNQMNHGQHPKQLYSLPDPYPTPRVMGKNPYYASILLEDYAGISGELTAIHHLIDDPFIQELLERIILDEEHHLQLFKTCRDEFCTTFYD